MLVESLNGKIVEDTCIVPCDLDSPGFFLLLDKQLILLPLSFNLT
jgi:hypothetical protein